MIYHAATQTDFAVIHDGILPLCDCALFLVEHDSHVAVFQYLGARLLQRLTVFYAHIAIELFCRRWRNEIEALGDKSVFEKNVILALRNDKQIFRHVFAENKPPLAVAVRASAYTEPPTLTERVKIYAVMSAYHLAVLRDDVAVFHRNVLREKLSEIALSDKANARAVLFLCDGNVEFEREFSDFGFCHIAERENDVAKLTGRNLIEKIRLILVVVLCSKQIMSIAVVPYSAIVSRRDIIRAEFAREIRKRSELDFAIAKHVGIGVLPFLYSSTKSLKRLFIYCSEKSTE